MTHPQVIEFVAIGHTANGIAHAWMERTEGKEDRFFKDVPMTVYSHALGREIGLSNVVEIPAREYHELFSIFAAAA